MEDISHLDPEVQLYVRKLWEIAPPDELPASIDFVRRSMDRKSAALNLPVPDTIETADHFVGLEGREIGIRIYRPAGLTRPPVILYFHGGGFFVGSYVSHDMQTWQMAEGAEACVISVNYRRLPENPYPAAMDDAFEILQWVARSADFLQIDPDRIAIAGDSAGGQITASLAIRARDAGGPALRYQALLYPMLDVDFTRPSYIEDKDPLCRRATLINCWNTYLQGRLDLADPHAIPMRVETMAGLPPAYVMTTEFDALRDEAYVYAERLREAGIHVDFSDVKGNVHSLLRATPVSRTAREEVARLHACLKHHLHR